MSTLSFYLERAEACRLEADGSALNNVRDRCLSAAAAWDSMADRARRTQSYRVAHDAEKAERIADQPQENA